MQVAEAERLSGPLRNLPHLVRRFFGHVASTSLTPAEQDEVRAALGDDRLASLFFRQSAPDQRHAVTVATRFRAVRPGDMDGYRAALLHDVGKAATSVGAVGRSMATVGDALSVPMPASWHTYRDHGPVGAAALQAAGADDLTVAFARHHPESAVPESIDAGVWQALLEADEI